MDCVYHDLVKSLEFIDETYLLWEKLRLQRKNEGAEQGCCGNEKTSLPCKSKFILQSRAAAKNKKMVQRKAVAETKNYYERRRLPCKTKVILQSQAATKHKNEGAEQGCGGHEKLV